MLLHIIKKKKKKDILYLLEIITNKRIKFFNIY